MGGVGLKFIVKCEKLRVGNWRLHKSKSDFLLDDSICLVLRLGRVNGATSHYCQICVFVAHFR